MKDDYEAFARTYHLEYGTIEDDVPFYVELAKETGGPALELAVGTGRVAIPVARAGVPVLGVDLSPTMLEVLGQRVANEPDLPLAFQKGDMRDFDATESGPFALAYCPARAFLHLLTPEDQLRALENVRRHLGDGGVFAGNFFFPRIDILLANSDGGGGWQWDHEYEDPVAGTTVVVSALNRADPREQQIRVTFRHDHLDENNVVVRTEFRRLSLCYIWPREWLHLLHRAGFADVAFFGGPDRQPFEDGGDELFWVARRHRRP